MNRKQKERLHVKLTVAVMQCAGLDDDAECRGGPDSTDVVTVQELNYLRDLVVRDVNGKVFQTQEERLMRDRSAQVTDGRTIKRVL